MGRWWFACGCGGVGRYKKGKFGTDGPRGCTDIGFLVLFGVFWFGIVYLASWAFTYGKAYRLIHGADSWGNVCGRSDNTVIDGVINSGLDMSERKHQYYSTLGGEGSEATTLCVAMCPDDSFSCDSNSTSLARCQNEYGVCLSGNNSVYTVPVDVQNPDRGFEFHNESTGCPTSIDKTIQAPVFKRCIPDSTKAVEYASYVLKRNGSYFEQVFESIMFLQKHLYERLISIHRPHSYQSCTSVRAGCTTPAHKHAQPLSYPPGGSLQAQLTESSSQM